ncbi:Ig-like domain-containing protein [Herbiconiux moechotypicola]|uniref:Ig-like domain-containing protein n=1 Tax=Herbiconiux moechotypicola TaxID=637393 RepID=A0ABP5Q720_9MICO|nr:Ig-like domain-containing protein [Herbiconiux moechotypicola]MCS5728725.1 Ig-like domain-containing protein [Herbiconiux moechotypicola]
MRLFQAIRRHKATSASVATVAAASIAVTTMAFLYEGVETADVDLNDGGVWVTKPSALLLGHLNHPAQVIDGGLRTSSTDFDVLQNGDTVLLLDSAGATLTPVNPMTVALESPVNLPPEASVSLGGDSVTLLDRQTGGLWAVDSAQVGSFTPDPEEPMAELGAGAAAVADSEGTVHALSTSDGRLLSYERDEATGAFPEEPTASTAFPEVEQSAQLTLTTVGDQAVVFDSATGTLYLPGGGVAELPDAQGGIVQASGPASDDVLVSTATTLIRQPLAGGEPVVLQTTGEPGDPAAPVFLNGCAYAAWSGSGSYLRDCAGDADDVESEVPDLAANASLRFRVNRDVVVLNDVATGVVYLVNQDMKKVDNWDDIAPPPEESDSEEEEDSTEEELQVLLPDRSEENTPPTAVDDSFGVRAGRTVILPVLNNDTDPDGDVLTASLSGNGPSFGEVQRILNGAALQVVVEPDARGASSFSYTADDGRGGTDTATVSLTVRGDGENSPPKQRQVSDVLVELGATVKHNALPDFEDPDGDDLYVTAASTGTADQVQFRPDGEITFTSIDPNTGPKDVTVTISDGRSEIEGTIRFVVRDKGALAPVTTPDAVVATVGERVTVAPLENDLSPSGAPLRLAKVNETPGLTLEPDYTTGTFAVTGASVGVFYVQYLVADGPKTAEGLVRVDVVADEDTEDPPIAVRDTAQLPTGRTTLVNVLANDTDPNGGILAVQSVQTDPDSGISVEVLEHQILRIADRGLVGPTTVRYTVSNGYASAVGEVFVTPIASPERLQPPVAVDDTVTVRVNDVATIPVLANDYHPDGDTIRLSETLIEPLVAPADGQIFVAEDVVRFRAGPEPKTVYATYEVVDSQGQKDAGYITIRVVGDDGANSPPRPEDVTIRALQGTSVRIPIPLDGIDPDGDSVRLVGQSSAPAKGRITEVGESWLVYEAYPDATGTDTFTYAVQDRLGGLATATVLVGIIPASDANQAPYAQKDTVQARPGRTLAVDVMANDSDPDGDPIAIRENGLEVPDGVTAEVDGGRVVVTAPDQAGDYTVLYTIVDRWGAASTGSLLVSVSPDAPLQAPIARDDTVPVSDVLDRPYVDIDVRENDDDPDGTIDELVVSTADATATVQPNQNLRIELLPTEQIVSYTVTDQDGLTASAFVTVPGMDTLPPVLRPGIEPIVVNDGETIDLELGDYVLVAEGKSVRITEAEKVRASNSNGDNLVAGETTLRYTPKARYDGPDAISFEVTDGTGPDDPAGHKATLVIPIQVVSDYNTPPSFVNTAVSVAAGDGEGTVDLRANSQDPDEGELDALTYTIAGDTGAGVNARIEGATLVVTADVDAPRTSSPVEIDVSDGVNPPVRGTVTVTVLATTRNPPSATDDVVPQANQGQTVTVDVLSNDYNPFPESPLEITQVVVETGSGNASANGSSVDVTPAGDFVGTMVVRYRVADVTGEPDRVADGRIRLTVQGRPDAPATPTVTSIQDRTVVLSWSPPINNGAEITGYTVTSPQGYSKQCASTTCTLDGLTNDVEYTFTVTATNSVGVSDASPPSAVARPDARPDQPEAPKLVFGDESLTVTWVTPPTPGSAVESFNLEISPAPARGAATRYDVTGNSLVWEGLENGTAYQVRVQAVNRAPEPSEFSTFSAEEIPARAPDAAAAPTTTRLNPVGDRAQLQVAWTPPANNGDAISAYTLEVLRGGSVVSTIDAGTSTEQAVPLDISETDYTFRVTAENKAGAGEPSPQSAPRRAFLAPTAPGAPSLAEGDRQITMTVGSPADGRGARQDELTYQYRLNGGGWSSLPSGGVIGGLQNGQSYSVETRAVTPLDGTNYEGPPSAASNTVVPYGPLGQPSASASGGATTVSLSWQAPQPNGRDITSIQVLVDGAAYSSAPSGSVTVGNGYSQTHSVRITVTDAAGQTVSAEASATSDPEPPPPPKGAFLSSWTSCDGENLVNGPPCVRMKLTVENFLGQGSVHCTWSGGNNLSTDISVDGNGNGSKNLSWFTQDSGAYSLENQAARMQCDGVQVVARR